MQKTLLKAMCSITIYLIHDTIAFCIFLKLIVQDLIKEVPQVLYIKYFSDVASIQYNNFKHFIKLSHYEKNNGVNSE